MTEDDKVFLVWSPDKGGTEATAVWITARYAAEAAENYVADVEVFGLGFDGEEHEIYVKDAEKTRRFFVEIEMEALYTAFEDEEIDDA